MVLALLLCSLALSADALGNHHPNHHPNHHARQPTDTTNLLQHRALVRRSAPSSSSKYAMKEERIHSQNGEDGIIDSICGIVGCHLKNYVEFGAEDCTECNSRHLREKGWKGLVMDGSHENKAINLRKEMITVENIVDLFHKYDVQKELDFLSVDVDGMDFYVLRHILCSGHFKPKIIAVEYNSHIPHNAGAVITPLTSPPSRCIGYCNGMSLAAVKALGAKFGYKLVYAMSVGVNAFLVREDALPADFPVPDLAHLDRPSTYRSEGRDAWRKAQPHWDDVEKDKTYLLSTCEAPHYADQAEKEAAAAKASKKLTAKSAGKVTKQMASKASVPSSKKELKAKAPKHEKVQLSKKAEADVKKAAALKTAKELAVVKAPKWPLQSDAMSVKRMTSKTSAPSSKNELKAKASKHEQPAVLKKAAVVKAAKELAAKPVAKATERKASKAPAASSVKKMPVVKAANTKDAKVSSARSGDKKDVK